MQFMADEGRRDMERRFLQRHSLWYAAQGSFKQTLTQTVNNPNEMHWVMWKISDMVHFQYEVFLEVIGVTSVQDRDPGKVKRE